MLKNGIEIPESKCFPVRLNASYYREIGITEANYLAIPAIDQENFDISQFFEKATKFIDAAFKLSEEMATAASASSNSAKVVVHCAKGRSRSATIVIAYLLMRSHDPFLSLEKAIEFVRCRRDIYPNDGFLEQLIQLENRLQATRESDLVKHSKEMVGKSLIQTTTSSQIVPSTLPTTKKYFTSPNQNVPSIVPTRRKFYAGPRQTVISTLPTTTRKTYTGIKQTIPPTVRNERKAYTGNTHPTNKTAKPSTMARISQVS